jgi:hypothetical protein
MSFSIAWRKNKNQLQCRIIMTPMKKSLNLQ